MFHYKLSLVTDYKTKKQFPSNWLGMTDYDDSFVYQIVPSLYVETCPFDFSCHLSIYADYFEQKRSGAIMLRQNYLIKN